MSIETQLQGAIDYCNEKLADKGVTEIATNIVDIGNKIENVESLPEFLDYLYNITINPAAVLPSITNVYIGECAVAYSSSNCSNSSKKTLRLYGPGKLTTLTSAFYQCNFSNIVFDIDTSNVAYWKEAFNRTYSLKVIEGEPLDFSAAKSSSSLQNTFANCTQLVEIRIKENTIKISFSIPQTQVLSADSVQSIINGLADMTEQTAPTLTLNTVVKQKMTETQIAEITAKNWTLA